MFYAAWMGTWAENERIYQAPKNAVREPHGRKRGMSGQDRLVLARLVWPSETIVVPARLLWIDGGCGAGGVVAAWRADFMCKEY